MLGHTEGLILKSDHYPAGIKLRARISHSKTSIFKHEDGKRNIL
jgi:hypothetical protein